MPKINVYLPDDLADAVRDAGVPVSAICQRALEQAVRRMTAIRSAVLDDLHPDKVAARLPGFTARLVTVITLAADRAKQAGAPCVTTGDLLHGIVTERDNLAVRILGALEIDAAALEVPDTAEPPIPGDGLRWSAPASVAVELAVSEAIGMGHNYVGCEHLLLGLTGEPDGATGDLLRSRGADARATRRGVAAVLAGYAAASANKPGAPTGLVTVIRAELAPLLERIERLESHLN